MKEKQRYNKIVEWENGILLKKSSIFDLLLSWTMGIFIVILFPLVYIINQRGIYWEKRK